MIYFTVGYKGFHKKIFAGNAKKLENALAIQIHKDTRPFVPALTMSLNNRSFVHGNKIVYPGPYARYLYEGKVMVDAETGRGPFYIDEVGFRFRKGARLRPTNRDLTFNTNVHPDATSHWMEVSERRNGHKWAAMGAKVYLNGK